MTASQSPLLPNTFGISESAEHFFALENEAQLKELSDTQKFPRPLHILGGGSNILLTGPVAGTVAQVRLKGISVVKEDQDHVWLKAAAGEAWHSLVLYAVAHNYGGIENLALIPGTVGASPIQNIGAYGVEVRETVESVSCWQLEEGRMITLGNAACRFGYRDSVFKKELAGKVIVCSVTYCLSKLPELRLDYGAIREELAKQGVIHPTIRDVAQSVISIRQSKLPDPNVLGNAGSFFKNPVVDEDRFLKIKDLNPEAPSFTAGAGQVKLPAAWLIEQCGWKGFREGRAGVHNRQALVLVNYGGATGPELLRLSANIIQSVKDRFGIPLEREVQVW